MKRPRILAVSNYYPPHHVGGYELGARDLLEQLQARGYHVEVLTSTHGTVGPTTSGGIHRLLGLEYAMNHASRPRRMLYLLQRERASRLAFEHACKLARPDLVYAFNLRNISISMLFQAEKQQLPVFYFASDGWLAHWEQDLWHRVTRRRAQLNLDRAQFVSRYLKDDALSNGKRVGAAEVIPWGVATSRYTPRPARADRCRLLFAGQLAAHKGLHTAIEALALVRARLPDVGAHLSLAGRFLDGDYEAATRASIARLDLTDAVTFLGSVPRDELARRFAEFDVFVFPSVWEEPFSIVLLEAMLCGLAIVATPTGGTPEIAEDRVNCLLFEKEDAAACAERIIELYADPQLAQRLRENAERLIRERHQLHQMVDRVEATLLAGV